MLNLDPDTVIDALEAARGEDMMSGCGKGETQRHRHVDELLRALLMCPFIHTNPKVLDKVTKFCSIYSVYETRLASLMAERAAADSELHIALDMIGLAEECL